VLSPDLIVFIEWLRYSIFQIVVTQITRHKIFMYLIVIAWFYVTLLMTLAEAFSSQGTVLGAIITFLFYGVLPMSLVIYLFGSPLRRKARLKAEQSRLTNKPQSGDSALQPNTSGHAPALAEQTAVTPVRKEPV
jgi:hypothetical protein